MGYRVVLRHGPKVEKHDADTLEAALSLFERRAREIADGPGRDTVDVRVRRFERAKPAHERSVARGDAPGPGNPEAVEVHAQRRPEGAQLA